MLGEASDLEVRSVTENANGVPYYWVFLTVRACVIMGQLGLACFIILHHNPIIRPLAAYSPLGCMKPQPQASTSFESLMEGRLRMSTDQGVQTRYLGKQSFLGFEPVNRVNCSY